MLLFSSGRYFSSNWPSGRRRRHICMEHRGAADDDSAELFCNMNVRSNKLNDVETQRRRVGVEGGEEGGGDIH